MMVLRSELRLEIDWVPIQNNLAAIQKGREQVNRAVRDEISCNRQKNAAQSETLRREVCTDSN